MSNKIYKNAPIAEAVLDIRVNQTQISNIESIQKLKEKELKDYPILNKRINFEGKIELNVQEDNILSNTASNIIGYVFSNEDNNRKVQVRTDGFTCNMLAPYTNWNNFFELAKEYWKVYKDFAKPDVVTRIALRYINRIELPLNNLNFEDYLTSVPKIPNCLPQKFGRYFLQMQVPCIENHIYSTISQTFEPPKTNYIPFIIDIDVFDTKIVSSGDLKLEDFEKLRKFKNEIFEDLITDKTRNLFK